MEKETPNESVRHLLMMISFASTKLVSHIVLRFVCFLACAPPLFDFITLGFQIWDLGLYLLNRFLSGLDECSPAFFFLVKVLALTSALDFESLPLVKDRLFLSVRLLVPIWIIPDAKAPLLLWPARPCYLHPYSKPVGLGSPIVHIASSRWAWSTFMQFHFVQSHGLSDALSWNLFCRSGRSTAQN